MHPNPSYRQTPRQTNLDFARDTGFGILALSDDAGLPLMSHIPFLIDGDEVLFHLVRANPIAARLKQPRPARFAISGPHGYVSPDWYGIDDQVPTWNYVAVHLTGTADLLPDDRLRDVLDRLSDRFETALAPKPVWTSDKMPDQALTRMMRMIVPARMRIEDVSGTWKLAQNKPEAARLGAADGVETSGIGTGLAGLAALMRDLPPDQ
ncbi:Protease synthase and sporulation protein PAI 2 [Thalassovita gelatinovora]|uniref:Protease synthase and sporulation protein PAI 2 n=1 Tax=Thalassovita gelatinovora TaxID=53501 RepID=A0A0P1F666_THAGE|nr:FMN-binding negative transcriptional regulator [Thalassovita gelatinovora]QIZ80909.1 FMN-binding negative transcriptional regulator [Thalassovita gelatinovora]CUH63396.1 Protease synthase and sporulation protein PAI 2 [Thalassovita gelatinovora]SEQ66344.1 negative transcriptional regulator, PaiB family [Thalassovita gelatinovora]